MNKRMLDIPGQGSATLSRTAARTSAGSPPPNPMPLFRKTLTDETRERIRRDFPGWHLYARQRNFDDWIAEKGEPDDYPAAFYGFMRQHHAKHATV